MPYAAHNVVRIQGTLPGGEVWSVNTRWNDFGGPLNTYEELQAWAESIGTALTTSTTITPLRAAMSVAATINVIRTEYVEAGGTLGGAADFTLVTPLAGTGTATKPFQTAIVCSLLTRRPGRSYRGRIYWPALAIAMEPSTLRLTPATRTSMLTGFAALFDLVQAASGVEGAPDLIVASETLGVNTVVRQLAVGDVLDTQRRRRDSLQEQYSTADYNPL